MAKERLETEVVENVELETDEERDAVPEENEETEVEEPNTEEEETSSTEEAASDEEEEGGEGEEEDTEESDQLIVTIGDVEDEPEEDEHKPAPQWVKDLRKKSREDAKRIKELERQLAERNSTEEEKLGPQPTLESSEYDAKVYEQELKKWFERKRKIEERQAQENAEKERQQKEYQERLANYQKAKIRLKVPDFEDAEEVVLGLFNENQQGAIVQGSADPALLVYALGKNEKKAQELATIKDPVQFIFAVAKLEAQLKVTNSKPKPKPERKIKSTGSTSGVIDSTLDQLRKEAERTGDFTKVVAYKRHKRQSNGS